MSGEFRLQKDANGKFYFVLHDENGKPLLQSRGYGKICALEAGVEVARRAAARLDAMAVTSISSSQSQVTLYGRNGQVIATSRPVNADSASALMDRLKRVTKAATVVDARRPGK